MSPLARVLDVRAVLTPLDHQTHRRYPFDVPPDCQRVEITVRYAPKRLAEDVSRRLAARVLREQAARLVPRVGRDLAAEWAINLTRRAESVRIPNLLTISLDDAAGVYRGAGHRQADEQRLEIGRDGASPGLMPGPLVAGTWLLTLSAHTVVTPQCEVSIQIGAEMPSSRPSAFLTSAK